MFTFERGLKPNESMSVGVKLIPIVKIVKNKNMIEIHCPEDVIIENDDVINELLTSNINIIAYSTICYEQR